MRSRRTRATSAGVPSRSRTGTGSRARRARQPEGNRAGTPVGGAGVRRFIVLKRIPKTRPAPPPLQSAWGEGELAWPEPIAEPIPGGSERCEGSEPAKSIPTRKIGDRVLRLLTSNCGVSRLWTAADATDPLHQDVLPSKNAKPQPSGRKPHDVSR